MAHLINMYILKLSVGYKFRFSSALIIAQSQLTICIPTPAVHITAVCASNSVPQAGCYTCHLQPTQTCGELRC